MSLNSSDLVEGYDLTPAYYDKFINIIQKPKK